MKHSCLLLLLLSCLLPVGADARTVTFFLDGARVEHEAVAVKGRIDLPLPAQMLPNSLRVKPAAGTEIQQVEIVATPSAAKQSKEMTTLTERRDRLQARLKALDAREEIFKAAARSQSAKAPRKTKTNPEPISSIRRGTDYALTQLEEVYRLRLSAEKELKEVELRLAERAATPGTMARIRLKSREGTVKVSYVLPDQGWKPVYDFRASAEGRVNILQRAAHPAQERDVTVFVVASSVAATGTGRTPQVAVVDGIVNRYVFDAEHKTRVEKPLSYLAFSFTNKSNDTLPPGEAACFNNGEYLGNFSFPGVAPGESREISCGW